MWIILSAFTALFYAAIGIWIKKITKRVNSYIITWAMFAFAAPFLLAPLLIAGIPQVKTSFYLGTAGSLVLNMFALTLYVKAVKISPISMVFPLLSFTPVFLIFTGYMFLGEIPNIFGISGIIFVTFGAYVMNMGRIKDGFFAPIKAIKEEKGAGMMLVVAFLWSFAASLDKVAVLGSSPYMYILIFNIGFAVLYLPLLFKVKPDFIFEVKANFLRLLLLGIFGALLFICQMTAIKFMLVSYVIAIKRAGVIFTLIFGWLFFKENLSIFKILGTVLMITGIFLIAFFN